MTTEEKAKAYDEAKEKMHEIITMDDNPMRPTEIAKCLFPELAESEDERIRKEILSFIRLCFSRTNFGSRSIALRKEDAEMFEKWIAYLEKQKEQKPDYCHHEVDLSGCSEEYIKGYYDGWNNCNQQHSQLEAEQKPAEWSDTDNIGWDEAFACVTRAEKAAKNEEELQNAVTAEKWLKEIKFKYYVHPVEQEWSEEDRKMLEVISYKISQHQGNDERSLFTPDEAEFISEIEDKLKSLRPQPRWKPSPLQLQVLRLAANDELLACEELDVLDNLYEQLKKL